MGEPAVLRLLLRPAVAGARRGEEQGRRGLPAEAEEEGCVEESDLF